MVKFINKVWFKLASKLRKPNPERERRGAICGNMHPNLNIVRAIPGTDRVREAPENIFREIRYTLHLYQPGSNDDAMYEWIDEDGNRCMSVPTRQPAPAPAYAPFDTMDTGLPDYDTATADAPAVSPTNRSVQEYEVYMAEDDYQTAVDAGEMGTLLQEMARHQREDHREFDVRVRR